MPTENSISHLNRLQWYLCQTTLILLNLELTVAQVCTALDIRNLEELALGPELIHLVLFNLLLEKVIFIHMSHQLEMTLLISLILQLVDDDLKPLLLLLLFQ